MYRQNPATPRWFVIGLVGGCLLAGSRWAVGQDGKVLAMQTQGLLREQKYDEARRLLDAALRKEWSEEDDRRVLLFYRALADHQQAGREGADRKALLESAAKYYSAALRLDPDWTPALNNLARLRAEQGKHAEAGNLFQAAVRQGDRFQGTSAANYGDYLLKRGERSDAAKYYQRAVIAQPDDTQLHEKLVKTYLEHGELAELLAYLWKLTDTERFPLAQDTSLQLLERPVSDADLRNETLTIVVVCLSRQNIRPAALAETAVTRRLAELAGAQEALAPAVAEIRRLYTDEELSPAQYRWWSKRFELDRDPPRGVWPKDGFTRLINATGDCFRHEKDFERAGRYYRLALTLSEQDVDPEALQRLAEMYASRGRLQDVEPLLREFEDRMFDAKIAAYRGSRADRIYRFHRSLGLVYSLVGSWGSPQDAHSAIFQLERAIRTVEEYNERFRRAGDKPLAVEPQLVAKLAEAYAKAGQPREAFETRVRASEKYIESRNPAAADYLLRDVDMKELSGAATSAQLRRWDGVRNKLRP